MKTPSLHFDRQYFSAVPLFFILVMTLAICVELVVNASDRFAEVKNHHMVLMERAAIAAARDVERLLEDQRHLAALMAEEESGLMNHLARYPDDQVARGILVNRMRRHFSNFVSLMLADSAGVILLDEPEFQINDYCIMDIELYASERDSFQVSVHPNADSGIHHFDTLVPWKITGHKPGVFLISQRLNDIAEVLRTYTEPGYQLILLHRYQHGLIEVSANGGRNEIPREARLSEIEMQRSLFLTPVADTLWDVIVLPDADIFLAEQERIYTNTRWMVVAILIAGILMLIVITWQDRRRHQLEQQIAQHQADLGRVARLNLLGEMASGLAHEINQPLSAISNYARGCIRRIEGGEKDTGKLFDALVGVSKQAERAGAIIQRIRKFVRSEERYDEAIDLPALVRSAIEFIQPYQNRHRVRINVHPERRLPLAWGDPIQIEQVIINLLNNAIEVLAQNAIRRRRIDVYIKYQEAGEVMLVVADNGPGLSAEALEHMYDPFFTTKQGGMGLGLAISHSIIEAHGGRLWAETGETGGARLCFTLPTDRVEVFE